MPVLTIKNISEDSYKELKLAAEEQYTSVNLINAHFDRN